LVEDSTVNQRLTRRSPDEKITPIPTPMPDRPVAPTLCLRSVLQYNGNGWFCNQRSPIPDRRSTNRCSIDRGWM